MMMNVDFGHREVCVVNFEEGPTTSVKGVSRVIKQR